MPYAPSADASALVARTGRSDRADYLVVAPDGRTEWVDRAEAATAFASMRDAARMAARLPASQRAYGLPRASELHAAACA